MTNPFEYSSDTSKKVIAYLRDKKALGAAELKTLEAKAATQKTPAIRVFLEENPELTEKASQLIAHLTGSGYFANQEKIPVEEHAVFNADAVETLGACLIKDAEGEKVLCLDPQHPGFKEAMGKANLQTKTVLVLSQITLQHIKNNRKRLVGHARKSAVSMVNEGDEEAGNANAFVYAMLKDCIEMGASDIHIDLATDEQAQPGFKLRFRVDGTCKDADFSTDMTLYHGIINKLKLDSSLKIDERRLPQDGRVSFELNGRTHNFRLSIMPCTIRNMQEEKVVLRQMADVKKCDLYGLDLLPYCLSLLEKALTYPHGFVCVTGPTGSGKTTLLYAILQQIDRAGKNLITLEDPIEAEIPLVNQSQIFHRIGYDFAMGLRVILRQDPDIVMVGEMRDEETANKAFEAANTGHLVFSTLHTNTAASSITRLLQMKVPYYFISSALKFVVAQRLVRRVCTECRRPHPDADHVMSEIAAAFKDAPKPILELFKEAKKEATLFAPHPNGQPCDRCKGARYKGRMAIMEVMQVNDEIRRIVNFEHGDEEKIEVAALKNGMLSIKQYGYLQALKGLTTFEEVNSAVLLT